MAKKRKRPARPAEEPPSRLARVIDNLIRHKLKWIFGALVAIGPAGIAASYDTIQPWLVGFIYEDHTYLTYLRLRDAQQALKDAQTSLAKNPDDRTAQRSVDYYNAIIAKFKKQLDKAAGN